MLSQAGHGQYCPPQTNDMESSKLHSSLRSTPATSIKDIIYSSVPNVSVAIQLSTFISCTNQTYKKIIYIQKEIIETCITIVNTWT